MSDTRMLNKAKAALLLSVAFLHVNDEPTSADPVARYVDDRNPGKIVRGKSRLHLHGATLSDSFVYGRQPLPWHHFRAARNYLRLQVVP